MEDYEKKYKEALERARKLHNEAKANEYTSDIEDYETIFPELKESEDERIRKRIVNIITTYYGNPNDEDVKPLLDWLENLEGAIIIPKSKQGHGIDVGLEGPLGPNGMDEKYRTPEEMIANDDSPDACFIRGWNKGYDTGFSYGKTAAKSSKWSKEDEEMREKLLGEIEDMLEKLPDDYEDMDSDDQDRYNELNNMSVWLSNLIPKSHWKPSEEHLEALEDAVRLDNTVIRKERLAHLLTQLKNL